MTRTKTPLQQISGGRDPLQGGSVTPDFGAFLFKNGEKGYAYLLIVAFSASMEVCRPASTLIVRSSISRDT